MAEIKDSLKGINAELKKIKESGEEGSEGYKALKIQQRELNTELKSLKHNLDVNDASINDLNESLRHWQKEVKQAKVGTEEWVDATKKVGEIKNRLRDVNDEMDELGGMVNKQPSLWDSMKVSVLSVFTGVGLFDLVKSAAGAVFELGMDIFNTTAKFEKYEAVLRNTLGSQHAAAAAMGDIKKFAAETPFSVDELTNSYIKFVNRGLQPSMTEMTKMGDIAASQGKSFEQLTEAILDAGTGEFERLKDFGINASKAGEQVTFSFKGVNTTVANTPEAIQGAILAFGDLEGVAGSMSAISQTLEGRVSNLGDNYDSLQLIIGDSLKPMFGFLIDVMNTGIDVVKTLFTESEPIVVVFDNIAEMVRTAGESFVNLAKNILPTNDASLTMRDVINGVSIAFQAVSNPLRIFIAFLQGGFDALNAVINKGKEVANFFGAEFKIDPSATFSTMQGNFEKNMDGIKNSWSKTMSEVHSFNPSGLMDYFGSFRHEYF